MRLNAFLWGVFITLAIWASYAPLVNRINPSPKAALQGVEISGEEQILNFRCYRVPVIPLKTEKKAKKGLK